MCLNEFGKTRRFPCDGVSPDSDGCEDIRAGGVGLGCDRQVRRFIRQAHLGVRDYCSLLVQNCPLDGAHVHLGKKRRADEHAENNGNCKKNATKNTRSSFHFLPPKLLWPTDPERCNSTATAIKRGRPAHDLSSDCIFLL